MALAIDFNSDFNNSLIYANQQVRFFSAWRWALSPGIDADEAAAKGTAAGWQP